MHRGSSSIDEMLLRKHKRTQKIEKTPSLVWNYQKIWTLFCCLVRELCLKPTRWFKQVRQFYWYWDGTRHIISFYAMHARVRTSLFSIFRPFPSYKSKWSCWKFAQHPNCSRIAQKVHWEKLEWNSNEKKTRKISVAVYCAKKYINIIYVFLRRHTE